MAESSKPKRSDSILRFSGMAFQMGLTIGLGVWAGIRLDERFPNSFHGWTLLLSILSVGLAMFMVIRDLMKK